MGALGVAPISSAFIEGSSQGQNESGPVRNIGLTIKKDATVPHETIELRILAST
jgi:hypothetical protein